MKKIYLLFYLIVISISANSQTTVSSNFPEDFGTDLSQTPDFTSGNVAGWTTTVTAGQIVLDDAFLSGSGLTSVSGGNVVVFNNSNSVTQTLKFASVSTGAFTNISVGWQLLYSATCPTVTAEWSADGTTWNTMTYVQPAQDNEWHACNSGVLPSGANGLSAFYLRFTVAQNGNANYILLDDVSIVGDASPIYYWMGGDLHDPNNWTDGSISPLDFTSANTTYILSDDASSLQSAVLTADWTIDGGNTVLYIGNPLLTTPPTFTLDIPSSFSLALGTGTDLPTMTVIDGGRVNLFNTIFPSNSQWSLLTGSTIDYAQTSAVDIMPLTYSDLIISGTNVSHNGSVININGNLDLQNNLTMSNAASGSTLVLNGTITGSGLLLTRTNSKLQIGGSGSLGTLNFGNGGTDKTLSVFTMARNSSGNVNLGTNLTVNNSAILRTGNLNINGKKLSLNGITTFSNTSTLGGSQTSSLSIGGAAGSAINNSLLFDQTSATTRAMDEIFVNRNTKTLTLGNPVEIWGNITPSIGGIAAGSGNLTIKSDATHKARIGPISATGTLTGNPTVEVYRPALKTDWINLCTGGVTGNTFSSWNSVFPMTCSTCPSGTGGTGITASVYSYNETLAAGNSANAAAYIDIDSFGGYSSTIDSKKGYYVFVGTSSPGTVGSALTIPLSGAVNTKNSSGNITITKTGSDPVEDGWNLISNPYPSALTASAVIATMGANINAASLQSYDPATGGYVMYSGSATIPMGQAFFVQSVVGSAAITPSETWKVTTNDNTAISKMASNSNFYFDDFLLNLTSNIVPDPFFTQAYFTFGNGYTTNYESGDCLSFEGTYTTTPRIAAYLYNKTLVRTAYPSLNGLTTIPVIVKTGYAGVYSINPVNLNKLPSGACVKLFDVANNISHDLRSGAYTTTIAANATTPQFELRITLTPATLTSNFTNPLCKKVGNGILVAKGNTTGPWNYTWKDINNNTIIIHNNVSTFDTLKNVAEGTYNVDVNTVGSCDNANTQFVLNATTPLPTALFTANTTTVSANSNIPVSFTNNSSNASNYLWNFGDGATANTANASHAYSNVGTFDVKLIATNGVCADSSIAHTQITALAGPAVGINNNTLANNNAFVSKDDDGVFVQLNFDAFTKTEITVTNILGQVITTKKIVVADKTKYYLNVPENEKIIFVTVEANNQKQTTKIIN